ncbi:thiamine pyrophosphate-dependent dehydrogenase E1 component subunit alpha [soil metagenome]
MTTVDVAIADAPIDLSRVPAAVADRLFAEMVIIREFEDRIKSLFAQGRIPGTIHLSHGQEACAVGGAAALRSDDWATLTHRGHGQAIAKGVSARSMMAELLARETGCCRGFGGSLHVGDMKVGAVPGIGIVGASIPIAAGLAFAEKRRGTDRVAMCFTGDGATTEGDAHEGYNLAALWGAPVIYLCENNLYSISTRIEQQSRVHSVAERVRAYGMRAVTVDGNDVIAVYEAAVDAVAQARAGDGPTLIECLTYRQGGHKRDDPATYRPAAEVALWMARDPIERMRLALVAAGKQETVDSAQAAATRTIDEAVQFAEASPLATGVVG